MNWTPSSVKPPDQPAGLRATQRQSQLTKPPGSLGVLEKLVCRLAALQRRDDPRIERVHISVFAADHGIAVEGVSAFPQAVTQAMVRNFLDGGAAINVLARHLRARFEVIDVGLLEPLDVPGLVISRAGNGTANFRWQPAMTTEQLNLALMTGKLAVARAKAQGADLFIGGEMGIANTASASAVAAALLDCPASIMTGAGTGLNDVQVRHKAAIIESALALHSRELNESLAVLRHVGGFEIAALTAAYLEAAAQGMSVLVDGFIASVAALAAVRIEPVCGEWLFYGHYSAEKGHKIVLDALCAEPILDLAMRLGEASGAAMAVPILQMACRLHNEMATFSQVNITTT
ncbi:MAG: nicotinate-nucleotide--dimethylbenzimidazole phosphoribosyltransferase [Methylomonas sp.]|nr:nicotinate-nucleotide--dimethylbenzimidazole phosphoribosyltransferase [Methylomonas sp.]PPD19833.1 MAG: nicotinate-nucleotide--dimethylbenzimidazole phosphoribosyltransferase [Methylomonas sp.]PPD26668.1 MAG: nicotinate-nucleotide--dimethylbenzimidazole phosphoribosyltransferase [Methylomonas sp.]PPD38476.1 MAG: nicotinate-nucleotide--dimethylbenzimidazole phosphoribosyltransferase [Methylomonas sp.]PPD55878.1 MAG: nicotinate-nucleotide--dimethylbenzimidazole phosphoribosyltransferase [Meth